jgi:hypothetical protein
LRILLPNYHYLILSFVICFFYFKEIPNEIFKISGNIESERIDKKYWQNEITEKFQEIEKIENVFHSLMMQYKKCQVNFEVLATLKQVFVTFCIVLFLS